jgi:hypothetical protein
LKRVDKMVKKQDKKRFLLMGIIIFIVVVIAIVMYYLNFNEDVKLAPVGCPPSWGASVPYPVHSTTVSYDSVTTVGLDPSGSWPGLGSGPWPFPGPEGEDKWCMHVCSSYGGNSAKQQCRQEIESLKPASPGCGSKCSAFGPSFIVSVFSPQGTAEFYAQTGSSVACECHITQTAQCWWDYGCSPPMQQAEAVPVDTGAGSIGTVTAGAADSATQTQIR